ncbi:MAG: cytochrome c5 family protein [Ottowia sp.]|nr:cytochrome c5 family protein [Ottowia sp.]
MTNKPHRTSSSASRKSSKHRTNWDLVGIAAAIAVILVGVMGYVALCPWNPFAEEHDAQAVAERVQKVGSVAIAAAEPASDASAPETAAADEGATQDSTAAAAEVPGKKLYEATCQMCHAAGISGAPKFGSKEEWAPRIATGMDAMMKVVFEGKGAMPARGASTASDDELRAAVQYMVDNAK